MKKTASIAVRAVTAALSAAGLVWVNLGSFLNAGSILGGVFFLTVIAACVFWNPLRRLLRRAWSALWSRLALLTLGGIAAALAVCCTVFSVNMALCANVPVERVEAVLVLGCQVIGEKPSIMLQDRLDAALEVLNGASEAICVVSGGKGRGEDISEAEAMRRYLMQNGIPEKRIFTESGSANTRGNIELSAEIFKELGIAENIVIVTNDFHQFRADIYARRFGLAVGHYSAKTPAAWLPNYWIREWAAIFIGYLT